MTARLTQRLDALATGYSRAPRGRPMTGCAEGPSGALWAEPGARLIPGSPFVLRAVGFEDRVQRAASVITGEGRLDRQTLSGKLVGQVARRCRAAKVPCHAVVGQIDLDENSRVSSTLPRFVQPVRWTTWSMRAGSLRSPRNDGRTAIRTRSTASSSGAQPSPEEATSRHCRRDPFDAECDR